MGFNVEYPQWLREGREVSQTLPEPQGGGHMLDAALSMAYPEGRKTLRRNVEGIYDQIEDPNMRYQTMAADMIPEDIGGALAATINPAYKNVQPAPMYKKLIDSLADYPDAIIPYIPRTNAIPLTVKVPGNDAEQFLGQWLGRGQSGYPSNAVYSTIMEGGKFAGDLITSLWNKAKDSIPHEWTHFLQDAVTGNLSKGTRQPNNQLKAAQLYNKELGRSVAPGNDIQTAQSAYGQSSKNLWENLGEKNRGELRTQWSYGDDDQKMVNEVVAEMARPDRLHRRLSEIAGPADSERYVAQLEARYPGIRAMVNASRKSLHPDIFWMP